MADNTPNTIEKVYADLSAAYRIAVDMIAARHNVEAEEAAAGTRLRRSREIFSPQEEIGRQNHPELDPILELANLIVQRERISSEGTEFQKRYDVIRERYDTLKQEFIATMPCNIWLRCGDQAVKWCGGEKNAHVIITDWNCALKEPGSDSMA